MQSKLLSFLLVPVISTFLLITIVTAAPTTIIGDINTKEIQIVDPVLPETTKIVASESPNKLVIDTAIVKPSVPSPKTVTSSKSAPSKQTNSASRSTPVKKVPTQPSRSISTPKTSISSSVQTKASTIIATSKTYIGVQYVFGGTTPSGFDCSGFVQYVFAKNGITLPRVSRDQFKVGTSVSFSNLQPGNLVFFSFAKNGVVDHVGIYVGNGQFINASSSKGVTIYTLGPYWKSVFVGAKRL